MNEWEIFEKVSYREAEMAVSIYKSGQMALTKAVCDAIGSDYVELLYNRGLNKIGIRASNIDSSNAHKLRKPKRQTSKMIGASAFLKYYQLDSIKSNKYPAKKEGDMVVVDANTPLK